MILDEKTLAKLGRVIPKPVAPDPARATELTDILREMKRFSSAVVQVLEKDDPPVAAPLVPIVSVAAPNVQIAVPPSAPTPRRWRFTVTRRDNTAQQRIQEIVIEPLE